MKTFFGNSEFEPIQLPTGLARLKKWWETVANRKSVRAIAKPQEFYLERYARLAQARKA